MERYWRFFDYVSERGANEIDEWLDSLPVSGVNKVEWLLSHLRGVKQLKRPYVGTRANYSEHFELIVDSAGRAFRPLGCYGPKRGEFTLLLGAEEKGGRLEPQAADRIADERRKIILADPTRVTQHDEEDDDEETKAN